MSAFSLRTRPRRHSSGERVFADELARLWSASFTEHGGGRAVVFACVTDARQPLRALAVSEEVRPGDLTESVLREWLTRAPRLEPLS